MDQSRTTTSNGSAATIKPHKRRAAAINPINGSAATIKPHQTPQSGNKPHKRRKAAINAAKRHHSYMKKLLLLCIGLWAFVACTKDDLKNPGIAPHDADFAFPLFSTQIGLDDLLYKVLNENLPGDTLLINPDNTMTLFYSGDVAKKPASEIFSDLAGLPGIPMTDTLLVAPFNTFNGVKITNAKLKKGRFAITLPFGYFSPSTPVSCTVRIPEMSSNGVPFKYEFSIAGPGQPYTSPIIDVSGYDLFSAENKIQYVYDARKPNGERVFLEIFGQPAMLVQFDTIEFAYAQGYWGYQEYPLTLDTIEIDINQTDLDGNVQVRNPKVRMRISNSWGFPTRGVLKQMIFVGQDGNKYPLVNTAFPDNYVDFGYPSYAAGEVGQTKYTDIYLDETNSNIGEIFNKQPTQLIYEVAGISNALNDTTIIGFITDKSEISLNLQVELLLEGLAKNFSAEQNFDLDFGGFDDLDSNDVKDVEFKLVTENATPVSTSLQIYFQDEAGSNIDSLFESGPRDIIRSAPVDATGLVNGSTRTENFIPMSNARFARVRNAKKAFMKTSFTTANNGETFVKLLSTNQATVKMGVRLKKKVN
jgi:hypothetical protein